MSWQMVLQDQDIYAEATVLDASWSVIARVFSLGAHPVALRSTLMALRDFRRILEGPHAAPLGSLAMPPDEQEAADRLVTRIGKMRHDLPVPCKVDAKRQPEGLVAEAMEYALPPFAPAKPGKDMLERMCEATTRAPAHVAAWMELWSTHLLEASWPPNFVESVEALSAVADSF
jgi:hypothetical protein